MIQALQQRARLRGVWLDRAEGLLREDERVDAVWLFGSEAKGTADERSDIDLFVALSDAADQRAGPRSRPAV